MTRYQVPQVELPREVGAKTAVLVASGDYRRTANVACWPAQKELEAGLRAAVEAAGWSLERAHPERRSDAEPHGFIHSQAYGREVFERIHPEAPLIVRVEIGNLAEDGVDRGPHRIQEDARRLLMGEGEPAERFEQLRLPDAAGAADAGAQVLGSMEHGRKFRDKRRGNHRLTAQLRTG